MKSGQYEGLKSWKRLFFTLLPSCLFVQKTTLSTLYLTDSEDAATPPAHRDGEIDREIGGSKSNNCTWNPGCCCVGNAYQNSAW